MGRIAGPRDIHYVSRAIAMGRSAHDLLARSLPAALLIAVAVVQIDLAYVRQLLTPAKGGGFGLFSTIDKLETRSLRAYAIGETREQPITLEALRSELPRARSLPSDAALDTIARTLLARSHPRPIVAVRVEVWKPDFDPASGRVRRVKVRELTLEKAGGGAP